MGRREVRRFWVGEENWDLGAAVRRYVSEALEVWKPRLSWPLRSHEDDRCVINTGLLKTFPRKGMGRRRSSGVESWTPTEVSNAHAPRSGTGETYIPRQWLNLV